MEERKKRTEETAREALRMAERNLRRKLPYLSEAFALAGSGRFDGGPSGTDGEGPVWNAREVCALFLSASETLERRFLHMTLHLLCLHAYRGAGVRARIWDLACDLAAEYRIDRMDAEGFERPIPAERSRVYRKLREEGVPFAERRLAEWLSARSGEELAELETAFRKDSHDRWRQTGGEDGPRTELWRNEPERLEERLAAVHRWRTVFEGIPLRREEHRRQKGGSVGDAQEQVQIERERDYDFRQFLKRFAVQGEELGIDLDSFDYIPYDYGRRLYDRLLLLEPLEYRDVTRLQDFMIAIDTSGSCSGETVRLFLEQTWEILNEEGNFFRRMNLHIVQCDCVVQEHVRIACEEDWKEYLSHIRVKGGGDTDFTPVFRLAGRLRESGELPDLRGLLYFTDGDGIYPSCRPPYETAFVFLNREGRKGEPPDWALTLELGI